MSNNTTTIWRVRELNILRKHYPDMSVLIVKLNKSAYKITKKAEELGLMNKSNSKPTVEAVRKCSRGGDHRSKAFKANQTCKLYEPKYRPIEVIEADIAQIEDRISKGIDNGQVWNEHIQRYNALCLEYDRALNKSK